MINPRIGLAAVLLGWLTFGTLAGAERSRLVPENPAMKAGLEAELASRSCRGVSLDVEAFRGYAHAHGMTHADFHTHRRPASLETSLAAYSGLLRRNPEAACERLLVDYGPDGRVVPLLRRG